MNCKGIDERRASSSDKLSANMPLKTLLISFYFKQSEVQGQCICNAKQMISTQAEVALQLVLIFTSQRREIAQLQTIASIGYGNHARWTRGEEQTDPACVNQAKNLSRKYQPVQQ